MKLAMVGDAVSPSLRGYFWAFKHVHQLTQSAAYGSRPTVRAEAAVHVPVLPASRSLHAAGLLHLELEVDHRGYRRLKLREDGYLTWVWRGHKVNYVAAGPGWLGEVVAPGTPGGSSAASRDGTCDSTHGDTRGSSGQGEPSGSTSGPPLVFIHGFGASVYHWRYNLPELAQHCRVYALDLLGFGWSDKALVEYSPGLWRQQVADFVREVVGERAVLVGNSVGGYAALSTAAFHMDQVAAVALVNAAGRFDEPGDPPAISKGGGQGVRGSGARPGGGNAEAAAAVVAAAPAAGEEGSLRHALQRVRDAVALAAKRLGLYLTFLQAKQPRRIQQVLELVYADKGSVDDALVRSIVVPTDAPNAAEVYFRLVTQVLLHPSSVPVNHLLDILRQHGGETQGQASGIPLGEDSLGPRGGVGAAGEEALGGSGPLRMLLLWGTLDPWITPAKADRIAALYPHAERVDVEAGHCPHDEAPHQVNQALLSWWRSLQV